MSDDRETRRERALALIHRNIETHGFHVYLVKGGLSPRFAYTIGLSERFGAELVFAGDALCDASDVHRAIAACAERAFVLGDRIDVPHLGSVSAGPVLPEWSTELVLGAMDYLQRSTVACVQIVPDSTRTIDVPSLGLPRDRSPCWKWLSSPCPYRLSDGDVAVTNRRALLGDAVTEAVRWEIDQWEAFSCSAEDVQKEDMRVVPLATLVAADESLAPAVELEVGKGMRRTGSTSRWEAWGN